MRFLILAFAVLSYGCAAQPSRIAQTESGWPQVEVRNAERRAVAQNLIQRNSETGWILEQESDSTLLFTRLDNRANLQSALTQSLIGNSSSTPPKYEARYTLTQISEGTKVFVNIAVSSQMPSGQVNRIYLQDNNEVFNVFQTQLNRVKSEFEKN